VGDVGCSAFARALENDTVFCTFPFRLFFPITAARFLTGPYMFGVDYSSFNTTATVKECDAIVMPICSHIFILFLVS
jgi:hypothetical protein